MHGIGNGLMVKQDDVNAYNQMAGKEMFAYIEDGDIDIVDVMADIVGVMS